VTRATKVALAVAGLATATRLGAAAFLGDRLHFDDEAVYYDAARRLSDGAGFGEGYRNAPGLPVVLAAFRSIGVDGVAGMRVAQAVVTGAGVAVVMALAVSVVGRGAALVAGLFYAVDPLLVVAAGLLYPEAVAAVVLPAAVAMTVAAARRGDGMRPAAAGALLGAVVLLRPAALVVAPVLAGWIVVRGRGGPRRRLWHAAVLLLGCGLLLAPWTYRNYRIHGALTPIATAGIEAAPVTAAEAESRGLGAALLQHARSEPWRLAARVGREFLHFWELYPQRLTTDNARFRAALHANDPRLPTEPSFPGGLRDRASALASALLLGLALLGVVAAWRARRSDVVLLLAVPLVLALGYALFIGKIRYRIPVVPLLMVLAGAGVAGCGTRTEER
jgi:hypothetical protein